MLNNYSKAQVKALEKEFKEFTEAKEEFLEEWYSLTSDALAELEGSPTLVFNTLGEYIRGELHYTTGEICYTTYENKYIVMYALVGTALSLFRPENAENLSKALKRDLGVGKYYIDIVNDMISMVQEMSDEWDITIV